MPNAEEVRALRPSERLPAKAQGFARIGNHRTLRRRSRPRREESIGLEVGHVQAHVARRQTLSGSTPVARQLGGVFGRDRDDDGRLARSFAGTDARTRNRSVPRCEPMEPRSFPGRSKAAVGQVPLPTSRRRARPPAHGRPNVPSPAGEGRAHPLFPSVQVMRELGHNVEAGSIEGVARRALNQTYRARSQQSEIVRSGPSSTRCTVTASQPPPVPNRVG